MVVIEQKKKVLKNFRSNFWTFFVRHAKKGHKFFGQLWMSANRGGGGGLSKSGQMRNRGGRGCKIGNFLRTSFMHGP